MKPAACYLRCSTDAQQESISEQREQIQRHAAGLGYAIIEEFTDDGISGTTTDRPGLQALIAACENGAPWDRVYIWDRKRLGRTEDPIDMMALTSQMERSGKKIVPLHGAQTTGNRLADNVVELVEFGQAGQESIDKSADVLRGQHHVAETGAHVCGRAPYGTDAFYVAGGKPVRRVRYTSHGKAELSLDGTEVLRPLPQGEIRMPGETVTLVPGEPKHADVVRRIYRDYAAGASAGSICVALNNEGVPSPAGKTWGPSTVLSILRNPVYSGNMVWNRVSTSEIHHATIGGKIIRIAPPARPKGPGKPKRRRRFNPEEEWVLTEDAWEGLISKEVWNAVAARLKRARRTPRALRGRGSKSVFLATGLARCRCGFAFSGSSGGGRKYYRCSGARLRGPSVCTTKSIRRELIDDYLERRIPEIYHEPAMEAELWKQVQEHLDEALDAELNSPNRADPRKELAKVRVQKDRVVDAIANNILTGGEAAAKLERLREAEARLDMEARSPFTGLNRAEVRSRMLGDVRHRMRQEGVLWKSATPAVRKHLIRAYVKGISVNEAESTISVSYLPPAFRLQCSSPW